MDTPLVRTRDDRVIAGVVGSLARRIGIDPTKARIAYVLLAALSAGFPGIAVYLVLWFLMDEEGAR